MEAEPGAARRLVVRRPDRGLPGGIPGGAADGGRWLHEAVYWLRHDANTDLNLTLPADAEVLSVAIDGDETAPLQAEPRRLWLPLTGRPAVCRVRVRWRYTAEDLARPEPGPADLARGAGRARPCGRCSSRPAGDRKGRRQGGPAFWIEHRRRPCRGSAPRPCCASARRWPSRRAEGGVRRRVGRGAAALLRGVPPGAGGVGGVAGHGRTGVAGRPEAEASLAGPPGAEQRTWRRNSISRRSCAKAESQRRRGRDGTADGAPAWAAEGRPLYAWAEAGASAPKAALTPEGGREPSAWAASAAWLGLLLLIGLSVAVALGRRLVARFVAGADRHTSAWSAGGRRGRSRWSWRSCCCWRLWGGW